MTKNEQFTFEIISQFLSAQLTRQEAAALLQIQERSVSRIASRVRRKGVLGITHGNRGRRASNRTPEAFEAMVMGLMEKRYFDCNLTHARELLEQEQGIEVGYDNLRRWCHKQGLVKRKQKRRSPARHQRVRMPNEGLLLQLDGSPHRYNGKDEWCLIGAIDDATSDIPYAEFFHSEDTLSCMQVLKRIIELKGIPQALYVDHAGIFGGAKRSQFAQFKRACEQLHIRVLFASSPEAKGRIERAWGTIQDRIIPEMRLRGIQRMPAANHFLQQQFLPGYWRQNNTVSPKLLESRYRPLPASVDLREIFCIKELRSINRDHTLSWNGTIYRFQSPHAYSIRKQKIELRTYLDLTWKAFYAGSPIEITPLPADPSSVAWGDPIAA